MVDQKGLTALDTVKDMPSKKSRQIAALVLGEPTPTLAEASFDTLAKSVTHLLSLRRRPHDWKTPRHRPAPSARPSAPGESQPAEKE